MSALDTLRGKIADSASATALASLITDEERALLTQGLALLQPSPFLKTTEARYYGRDSRGFIKSCPLPPGGFDAYGLTPALDSEILAQLIVEEREVATQTWEQPRRAW